MKNILRATLFVGVTIAARAQNDPEIHWQLWADSICGFRHDAENSGRPYLSDTISMGRAFLQLCAVTANRDWLKRADDALHFINDTSDGDTGYVPFAQPISSKLPPRPNVDENVAVARTADLLSRYTGNERQREMAAKAIKFFASPAVAENRGYQVAGILLAANELGATPLQITIVAEKSDPAAKRLFQTAIEQPSTYKRVEW